MCIITYFNQEPLAIHKTISSFYARYFGLAFVTPTSYEIGTHNKT